MKRNLTHLLHAIRLAVATPTATLALDFLSGDIDAAAGVHALIGIGVVAAGTVWGWLGAEIRKLEARYPIDG